MAKGKQVRISKESLDAANRARKRLNLPESCEGGVINGIIQSHADEYGSSEGEGDDESDDSKSKPAPADSSDDSEDSGHPFDNLMGAS